MRRPAAALLVTGALLLPAACGPSAPDAATESPESLAARAHEIHSRLLTIDTHDDIPLDFATEAVDPLDADRQVTIEKMEAGGLDVGFFVVYTGQTPRTPENYTVARQEAMAKFEAIHRMTEMYPDRIELAYSADDVERIVGGGKLVAAIGIENGYAIGKELGLLETYHELGARYITLAHGGHNDIADSATPREGLDAGDEEHGGLSDFGEEVVSEMNRLGIMVDVSHISKKAALHAMRVSRAPVIASHSSTRAVADHPRNMDDETLLALKENGGVIQTVALGSFVKVRTEFDSAQQEIWADMGIRSYPDFMALSGEERAEYDRRIADAEERWPPANVGDFVDHIDHAVNLIGIDHVGISSDFDGGGGIEGWNDASESSNVTVELVRRGYTEEEIAKLWGGNLLRVWRQVEEVAASTRGDM